ncbi:MAG: methyltransferase domain-containing protein [Planctomycetes bacterium]|nr:methyltransferase domain-containing protein [Planctomycetota bacterium]
MGLYTSITRSWLEARFRKRSEHGVYLAHMPIYGAAASDSEHNHIGRLARALRILRQLDALDYETLLDVGGAEGYLPHLARTIHGAEVVTTDLSHQACLRANELFGLRSAAVDCHRLPFGDDAFDVVVCSEVIEHVEHPVETMLELQRVARVAVILTTEEVHYDRRWIDDYLFRRPGWPHMERNLFHPDDLRTCFPNARLEPQCDERPPEATDAEAVRDWLRAHTRATELASGRIGVVVTDVRDATRARARRHDDDTLLARLLATTVVKGTTAPNPAALDELLPLLRDPDARTPLWVVDDKLVSPDGQHHPIRDGVPDFVQLARPAPSRVELADFLRRACPDRAAAMLALRDRLYLPDRWPNDHFDLRDAEQRRGFWPNEQLRPRAAGPGSGFAWQAIGPDPWVVTPCLQRPLRAVEIEMRVHAPDNPATKGTGQVFWKGPNDDTFVEQHSVKFDVPNDGQVHTFRVGLSDHPLLPDEVQWLRLDLIDGECELDFLSLRLV